MLLFGLNRCIDHGKILLLYGLNYSKPFPNSFWLTPSGDPERALSARRWGKARCLSLITSLLGMTMVSIVYPQVKKKFFAEDARNLPRFIRWKLQCRIILSRNVR